MLRTVGIVFRIHYVVYLPLLAGVFGIRDATNTQLVLPIYHACCRSQSTIMIVTYGTLQRTNIIKHGTNAVSSIGSPLAREKQALVLVHLQSGSHLILPQLLFFYR